ncbi:MAG: hypothetical protein EPO23_09610 [Xanthobacteraceae bacterium]|nr:MAG: hypothetical protein EPO23_09610 [Xanthobacteraceae bacterium]
MLEYLQTAKRYLWAFVEIGFVALLGIMLVYLLLGSGSGNFVQAVGQNVVKFANDVPAPSLVGFTLVGAILFVVTRRREG